MWKSINIYIFYQSSSGHDLSEIDNLFKTLYIMQHRPSYDELSGSMYVCKDDLR